MSRNPIAAAAFFAWTLVAAAQSSPDLSGYACKAIAEKKLVEWGSLDDWQAGPALLIRGIHFLTPTRKFGTWIGIEHRDDGFAGFKMSAFSNEQVQVISFDKHCKPFEWSTRREPVDENKYFTDSSLEQFIGAHDKGVVYVWHPGYAYSVESKSKFEAGAKKLGFAFMTILGAEVDPTKISDLLVKNGFGVPQLVEASIELSLRTSSTHYPRVYVFKEKKLARAVILGAMETTEFERQLKDIEAML